MANPRIEEVEDDDPSDPEEMDLDAFDFANPKGSLQQSTTEAAANSRIDPATLQSLLEPNNRQPPQSAKEEAREYARREREQRERSKNYQCIYPIYFDSSRSRQDGRRVRKEEGVANPLARELVEAIQHIGAETGIPFQIVLEPLKTHPKDWANPGRVKVCLKTNGEPVSKKLTSKHGLYHLISSYLQAHPTTPDAPLKLRLQGLPPPKDGNVPEPAVPRGFKMGTVLPLHSPALSGGGVSDNFLKDMMAEMGGQLPPGMEGMANMANMANIAGGGKGGKPKVVRVRK